MRPEFKPSLQVLTSSDVDLPLTGWDGGVEVVEEALLADRAHGVEVDAEDTGGYANAEGKVAAPHHGEAADAVPVVCLHPLDVHLVRLSQILHFCGDVNRLHLVHRRKCLVAPWHWYVHRRRRNHFHSRL